MMITVGIGSRHYVVIGGSTNKNRRPFAVILACMYAARARREIAHGFQPVHHIGATPAGAA